VAGQGLDGSGAERRVGVVGQGLDASGAERRVVDTLKIDLANIAGTPGARGDFEVSERFSPAEGISTMGPVTGEITVENTGSLLLVRGRLRAVLKLACVRCLGDTEQTVEVEVEEEFASEGAGPEVVTVDREEPEVSAISDYVLDLHEFVRQQITVNMPMAPLCRPDCRGICPQCGQDLNQGQCGCGVVAGSGAERRVVEGSEGRWAKLGELLKSRGRGPGGQRR
jgi:uncharacterized protein